MIAIGFKLIQIGFPFTGLIVLEIVLLVIFVNILRKPDALENRNILIAIYAVVFFLTVILVAYAIYFDDFTTHSQMIIAGSISGVLLTIFTISYLYLKPEEGSMSQESIR